MDSEASNLKVISTAIDTHERNCEFSLVQIDMNPFEVERLGWDSIRGIPINGNPDIGTGRFRLVCAGEVINKEDETVEAVAKESELVVR